MSICETIASVVANSASLPAELPARDFLLHAANCDRCAPLLLEHTQIASLMIEASQPTADDPADELRLQHDEALALGQVIADALDPVTHRAFSSGSGLEPLRYELRHASEIGGAPPAVIRCAVATSEMAHALEGLVLQDDHGFRKAVLTADVLYLDTVPVESRYFIERVSDAANVKHQAAAGFLKALTRMLVQHDQLTLAGFRTKTIPGHVMLIHEDDPDDAIIADRTRFSEVALGTDADVGWVVLIGAPITHGLPGWQAAQTAIGTMLRRNN